MSVIAAETLKKGAAAFLSEQGPGIRVLSLGPENGLQRMAMDVRQGLEQEPKSIPPTYFYDKAGSLLYEKITALEEYYPTRTEAALLQSIAPELKDRVGQVQMVELGSGSSAKTRILLDAWQADTEFLTYVPIDVSETMLRATAEKLTREYPQLQVLGLAGQYEDALSVLPPDRHRLVLFLGSTIGNFTPEFQQTFFVRLRALMTPGTQLLLGFDRQPHPGKPAGVIHRAYNDSQGITAQFNLNLLSHLNRNLGADFNLDLWRHEAVYNETRQQIEMYLRSLAHQVVTIDALRARYEFEADESILTEISRKFDPETLAHWFQETGYRYLTHWQDPKDYFGLMLLETV